MKTWDQRANEIFLGATQLNDGDARATYLECVCGDDDQLRGQVLNLLESHDTAGDFLENSHDHVTRTLVELKNLLVSSSAKPALFAMNSNGESGSTPPEVQQLGSYRLIRQLNQGGMGRVYEAINDALGQRVALKLTSVDGGLDDRARERFVREARTAAALNHPNIVPVFDVGEKCRVLYFAMPLIDGHSLRQSLIEMRQWYQAYSGRDAGGVRRSMHLLGNDDVDSQNASADRSQPSESEVTIVEYWRQVARIGWHIADALSFAHRSGVLHRDVKPSNILVERSGKILLADFGIAKTVGSDLTRTGDVVGTVRYMGPERLSGQSDARSDVYSLGMTLYELLTLRPAFDEPDHVVLLHNIQHHQPTAPRQIDRAIPRDLETIVLKASAKSPSDRFATADQLRDELGRFLDGRPILSRPAGWTERTWRWACRQPIVASLLASLAVLLALVLGILGYSEHLRQRERFISQRNTSLLGSEREARAREHTAWESAEQARREALDIAVNRRIDTASALFELAQVRHRHDDMAHAILTYAHVLHVLETPAADGGRSLVSQSSRATNLTQSTRRHLSAYAHSPIVPVRTIRHGGGVNELAFCTDGTHVVSACKDGTARIWDLKTGKTVGQAMRHEDWVNDVAVVGDEILTVSQDATCKYWARNTGQPTGKSFGANGSIAAIAVRPGNPSILATAEWAGTIRLWDLQTAAEIGEPLIVRNDNVRSIAFSPNGSRLAVAWWSGVVELWDVDRRSREAELSHEGEFISCVKYSPDGRYLATGAGDRHVRLWDVTTRQLARESLAVSSSVASLAFHPELPILAIGLQSRRIVFWNYTTGRRSDVDGAHHGLVSVIEFSADGQWLVTGSEDQTMRVWDVRSLAWQPDEIDMKSAINGIGIDPLGEQFAIALGNGVVQRWDVESRRPVGEPMIHPKGATAATYSSDGRWLATASNDGTARVWDLTNGTQFGPTLQHSAEVNCVAFSHDQQRLATGSNDESARIWNLERPDAEPIVLLQQGMVPCVCFSPDDRWLVTGCEDQTIRVWDASTGDSNGEPMLLNGWVTDITFDPSGTRLASASWSHEAQIWSIVNLQPISRAMDHDQKVNAVRFDPTGQMLAAVTWNGTVHLWDASTSTPLANGFNFQGDSLKSIAFARHGQLLISGGDEGVVRFWPVQDSLTTNAEEVYDWARSAAAAEMQDDGAILPWKPGNTEPGNTEPAGTAAEFMTPGWWTTLRQPRVFRPTQDSP